LGIYRWITDIEIGDVFAPMQIGNVWQYNTVSGSEYGSTIREAKAADNI